MESMYVDGFAALRVSFAPDNPGNGRKMNHAANASECVDHGPSIPDILGRTALEVKRAVFNASCFQDRTDMASNEPFGSRH
jgi:hypothetical protein